METFAYIQAAVSYEDPNSAPELTLNVNLPSSALMGLAGAAVVASVMAGSPEQAAAAIAPVSQGSAGAEVQAVQNALGIEADGQYGPKTEATVKDFQIRQGLKQIDGVVGPETATAMGLSETYQPTGVVDTISNAGLNIRTGPGLGYGIVDAVSDGTELVEVTQAVIINDGQYWRELDDGYWVATRYTEYDGFDDDIPDLYYAEQPPYYAEAEVSFDYDADADAFEVEVSARDIPDSYREAFFDAMDGDRVAMDIINDQVAEEVLVSFGE
jgi:hypothetical protein